MHLRGKVSGGTGHHREISRHPQAAKRQHWGVAAERHVSPDLGREDTLPPLLHLTYPASLSSGFVMLTEQGNNT